MEASIIYSNNNHSKMTEVFIAALSTTRFQMNDQDQQFYRDEKAKEIQEVRAALQQLHQFSQMHKKDRPQANHGLVWRNLLILSKILGFEADFNLIDQLRIPQAILTQQLWQLNDPFTLKHYYPRTSIGHWQTTSDRYYILMQGIVQKQLIRSSIAKFDGEIDLSLSKAVSNSKFKKNNRRRFARTDEQIPICLNSKRSQGRNPEVMAGNFRALTDVRMLEVSSSSWRRYVDDFKKLQEEYLMNFIRKKLNISLNLQDKALKKEVEESNQEAFYSLVTYQRKNVLQFNEFQILLLYMGEMLVSTGSYKIEVSRGCVINPAIHQAFRGENVKINGVAAAKSLSTVIKISIKKLENYLTVAEEERQGLIELLKGLEEGRRNKKEDERTIIMRTVQTSLSSLKHSKIRNRFYNGQQSQGEMRPICHSPSNFKKRSVDSTPIIRSKDKVIGLKSIENMVEKTAKAAELKHIQYLKKTHLTEESNTVQFSQENMVPGLLFKDCMRNIQNKNEMLKQAVKFQREKMKHEYGQRHKQLKADLRSESASKSKITSIVDGSIYIKKRMKDIYVRTEASQQMFTFTSSERTSTSPKPKPASRQTVGSALQMRQFTDKQLYTGCYKWYTGSLGIMKKVPTGKIRRIKIK